MDKGCCSDEWKGVWDPFVRLCYQFGMLLGVDEFAQEQGYMVSNQRLALRLFEGYGLVWGTPVSIDDATAQLTVGPLLAVDELGRKLWVKAPCKIKLADWLDENPDATANTDIFVTLEYQACCTSPVPAVAAPCDDAAAPTMPSRVRESVECRLSLVAPDAPFDLSDDPPGADKLTQADRFTALVDAISNDVRRPLLLGTLRASVIDPIARKTKSTFTLDPSLPRMAIADAGPIGGLGGAGGAGSLRVTAVAFDAGALKVTFNAAPAVFSSASFVLEEITPKAGASADVAQLVKGSVPTIVPATDGKQLSVALTRPPKSKTGYRVIVSGSGPDAVLGWSDAGPAPLGGGSDFIAHGLTP